MANYVLLLPTVQMLEQAGSAIQNLNIENVSMKTIQTDNALDEAHSAVQNGADVIIARGIQADLIKKHTDYTVIEITTTGQEMGLLVIQAKKIIRKKTPFIAVVGLKNMYCDMGHFDTLYKVKLRTYFVNSLDEIRISVHTAKNDGADIIIGGDTANKQAEELGLPYLFVNSAGEEAIRNALKTASSIGWAIDLERKHSAQLKTLLDYSFNGIIRITNDSKIEMMNSIAEDMLNIENEESKGENISSFISQFDSNILNSVLKGGHEHYTSYTEINEKAYAVSIAPVIMEKGLIDGAIISFSEVERIMEMEKKIRSYYYSKEQENLFEFELLEKLCQNLNTVISSAKTYAQTSSAILITGPIGSEKELLSQCIHNYSPFKNGIYVEFDCESQAGDSQFKYLFEGLEQQNIEDKGLFAAIGEGTILLSNIDCLTSQCQAYLLGILSKKTILQRPSLRHLPIRFRLIATSNNLQKLSEDRGFNPRLFYLLRMLSIDILPLSKRKEDLEAWLDYYIQIYCKKYSRYISLTADAKRVIKDYNWAGNTVQLKGFCECIVISAERRTVNQAFIENLLAEAYPTFPINKQHAEPIYYSNIEAAEIAALLEKYNGNRTDVAQQLGISTTTLWRRIKKLGIDNKRF